MFQPGHMCRQCGHLCSCTNRILKRGGLWARLPLRARSSSTILVENGAILVGRIGAKVLVVSRARARRATQPRKDRRSRSVRRNEQFTKKANSELAVRNVVRGGPASLTLVRTTMSAVLRSNYRQSRNFERGRKRMIQWASFVACPESERGNSKYIRLWHAVRTPCEMEDAPRKTLGADGPAGLLVEFSSSGGAPPFGRDALSVTFRMVRRIPPCKPVPLPPSFSVGPRIWTGQFGQRATVPIQDRASYSGERFPA